jgi:hypothetical protein
MKKHMRTVSIILLMAFALSACGSLQPYEPTFTPEPTLTPAPTLAPTPTLTPAPTLAPTPTLTPVPIMGKLEGKVVWSSNNEPISDFSLTLGDSEPLESTTRADGKYSFKDLKPGKYSVGIAWEIDRSGKPVPCQGFEIALPHSITGTALSMLGRNDFGRVLIAAGYEIEIKNGDQITADFQVGCK